MQPCTFESVSQQATVGAIHDLVSSIFEQKGMSPSKFADRLQVNVSESNAPALLVDEQRLAHATRISCAPGPLAQGVFFLKFMSTFRKKVRSGVKQT